MVASEEEEEEFEESRGAGSRHVEEGGRGTGSVEPSDVVLSDRQEAPKNTSA